MNALTTPVSYRLRFVPDKVVGIDELVSLVRNGYSGRLVDILDIRAAD